jgi:hypothetical protein
MPSFSAKPAPPTDAAAQEWISKAPVGAGRAAEKASEAKAKAATKPARPWEELDPRAPAAKAFNLRLNEYELALLRTCAEAEFCSQQALAKRILVRALEQAAKELK